MKTTRAWYLGLIASGVVVLLASGQARLSAQSADPAIRIGGRDLGGVVTSANGPERRPSTVQSPGTLSRCSGSGSGASAQLHTGSDASALRIAATVAAAAVPATGFATRPVRCSASARSRRMRSTDSPGVPLKTRPGLAQGVCDTSTA